MESIPEVSTSEMDLIISKITELGIDVILSSSALPIAIQSQISKAGSVVITRIPKEKLDKINEIYSVTPIMDLGMLDETMIGTAEILFERAQPSISSIFINDEDEMNLDSLERVILDVIDHLKQKLESGLSTLLTFIRWDDPVVRLLGGRVGDIIRINRKSATAKESVTYRIVTLE